MKTKVVQLVPKEQQQYLTCDMKCNIKSYTYIISLHMTRSEIKVPSQKFPVPKITKQTKSHSLNFNVLSSVIDSSGEEV